MLFYPICAYLLTFLVAGFFCAKYYFLNDINCTKKGNILVILSLVSALPPIALMLLYMYVYGNGGSAVVQFSVGRSDLWRLWFYIWPWLYISSHVFGIIAATVFFMNVRLNENKYSFFCRFFVLLLYPVTLFVIYTTMPDA